MDRQYLAVITAAEVAELLVKGLSAADIAKLLREKADLDASADEVADLMRQGNDYLATDADFNLEAERNKGIRRLNMLFQKSEKIQDYKACLAAQKEINVLLSLRREMPQESLPNLNGDYAP
ncbi:MAG: hypothetical protein NVS3B25_35260 [Hymenobacter sp.]